MPPGRPTDYRPEYCEIVLKVGGSVTHSDIADRIGVDVSTIYEWKNKYPHFADAIKVAKSRVDDQVENALNKSAIEGSNVAQIFWLKNRRRDEWKDRNTLEGSNDAPLSIAFKSILDKE